MKSKLGKMIFILLIVISTTITIVKAEQVKTIKIGYVPNYVTLTDPKIEGEEGYGYEYFKEISHYTSHNYEYIPLELGEGIEELESGEIDILGPVLKNKEREAKYGFTEESFGKEVITLIAHKDSEYNFNDIEEFNNKKIGVQSYSLYKEDIDKYLKENNINATIVDINSKTIEKDLENGVYDLVVESSTYMTPNTKVVANLGSNEMYYITRKDDIELIRELEYGLSQIQRNDFTFNEELYIKYYKDKYYAKKVLTEKQEEILKDIDTVRVGFDEDMLSLQYMKDNKAQGMAIDIINMIANDAGVKVQYIPINEETKVENLDLDLNISIMNGDELSDDNHLSKPYLSQNIMVCGSRDNIDKNNITIGVMEYKKQNLNKIYNMTEGYKLKIYQDVEDLRSDLELGKIDFVVGSSILVNYILGTLSHNDYVTYATQYKFNFRIEVNEELPREFIEILDILISRLNQVEVDALIMSNHHEVKRQITITEIMKTYTRELVVSTIIVFLVIIFIIIYHARKKRKDIQKALEVDSLTGYMTKYKFIKDAEKILKLAKNNEYSIIAIDIDNFSYINEIHGNNKANLFIKGYAKQLGKCYHNAVFISRFNTDNFILLMKTIHINEIPCQNEKCSNCTNQVAKNILGQNHKITISKGIYIIKDTNMSVIQMIENAIYAKKLGKHIYGNTSNVFTDEMKKQLEIKNKIVINMEEALINKEYKVIYQPKVNLKNNEIIGAEALVRWIRANDIQIYPDEFIPLFEKNGFIGKLDLYVFEEVCIFIKANKKILKNKTISVNISGQTLTNPRLLPELVSIVQKYEIEFEMIELEITESAIVDNFKEIADRISELKTIGFVISMDDFGSGVSSLNRFKDINVDIIKIDRIFLNGLLKDKKGIIIMESIITLAKSLQLKIVAEGVETKEQAQFLSELNCDIAQGYYFAKPMDSKKFIDLILK